MRHYEAIEPAQLEWRDGQPYCRRHDDIYFSRAGGLAETRHVFLQGNQLPQRWREGDQFSIGETGFGSGLNFLCTLNDWMLSAPAPARLHFISVEKFPLTKTDLRRALDAWPELAALAAELLHNYPPLVHGLHRREFCDGRVTLTLLFGDAAAMLSDIDAEIDAWYLDGFAPGRNAQMWSDELLQQIARLSKAGTTFATFSAAGMVKRGLKAAGFALKTQPGFGHKRHMLSGTLPSAAPQHPTHPWFVYPKIQPTEKRAIVIGAGLAGCTVSHALARRGWQITLIERHEKVAQEASGNLAGVVMPRLTADMSADGRFYLSAFLHTLHWLNQLQRHDASLPWFQSGVLQLCDEKQLQRMQKLALPGEVLEICDAASATQRCGVRTDKGGLFYPGGGWLDPPALCRWLLDDQHQRIETRLHQNALALQRQDGRWRVASETGVITEAEGVIIANGYDATRLLGTDLFTLQKVRGQLAYLAATTTSRQLKTPICYDGYIIPAYHDKHCAGASYDIGDESFELRNESETEILAALTKALPTFDSAPTSTGRVAFRTSTPDHLPLIGPLPDVAFYQAHYADLHHGRPASRYPSAEYLPGLYISAGHGSRGLVSCPMAAALITAMLNAEPMPLTREPLNACHPARFVVRQFKKQMRCP